MGSVALFLVAAEFCVGCAGTGSEENTADVAEGKPEQTLFWQSLAAMDPGLLGEIVWSAPDGKAAVCWVADLRKTVDASQVWMARNAALEPVARLRFSGDREKNSVGFIVEQGVVKKGDEVVATTTDLQAKWDKAHSAPEIVQ